MIEHEAGLTETVQAVEAHGGDGAEDAGDSSYRRPRNRNTSCQRKHRNLTRSDGDQEPRFSRRRNHQTYRADSGHRQSIRRIDYRLRDAGYRIR